MGMRFDLKSANWVAYLLHPSSPAPSFGEDWAEKETLRLFLQRLSDQFYSSDNRERELLRKARLAERMIEELGATDQRQRVADILKDIKIFFGDHPWIALIIPSGFDQEADNYLCDASFLRSLLRLFSAGLILQPEALNEEDANHFSLLDVFPAFRTALAESTNWPGILIWTPGGDSVFLPFGTTNVNQLSERASWIFSHLDAIGADLELIKQRYAKEFPDSFESWKHTIHFVQLSDLHIGSREAALRLARVEQLIRDVVNDLGPSAKVVPVVSGDVMDTPDERRLWEAKRFLGFLSQIGTEEPVVVLGNHDVRGNGFLSDKFREALRIPTKRVAWYRDLEIGLVCFDSVRGGRLARGYIGEEQLLDIGNEIDRERNHKNFSLLGMLHHHPVPVEVPDWYVKPFYERILGFTIDKTDELEDAAALLHFVKQRKLSAIMHGHKHIPRATKVGNDLVVFGCGSTVGKVSTTDGGTYMSLNIVSVNRRSRKLSGRLLAERIPGGGIVEQKRHEIMLRTRT